MSRDLHAALLRLISTNWSDRKLDEERTGNRTRQPHWWSDTIAELRRKCLNLRRRAQRTRPFGGEKHTEAYDAYRQSRRELRTEIKGSKQRSWNELCEIAEREKFLYKLSKEKDLPTTLEENITGALKLIKIEFDDVCECERLKDLNFTCRREDSVQWRFVSTLCYVLLTIADHVKQNLLSVNFQVCIKSSIEFVVPMGILPTLIPGMGVPIEKRTEFAHLYQIEELSHMEKYERLKALSNLFIALCKTSNFKRIIYASFLKDYLTALFQLSYAPIVKPGLAKLYDGSEFNMTEELWKRLIEEQIHYRSKLTDVIEKCYRPTVIRELLILQSVKDPPPPPFMRKILSRELSNILVSKEGLLHVIKCFFDCSSIDIGSQWKHIEMIKKLILVKHGSLTEDEYLTNICSQMREIIALQKNYDYKMVTAACLAGLSERYPKNEAVLKVIYAIIEPLLFTQNEQLTNGTLILSYNEVIDLVKSLELCFGHLPYHLMSPIIYHIFGLRVFASSHVKNFLNNLISQYFASKSCRANDWFDTLVFKTPHKEIRVNKNVYFDLTNDGLQVKYMIDAGNVTAEAAIDCILEMIEEFPDKKNFANAFYVFCLTSLMKLSETNDKSSSKELLECEDDTHNLISKESENMLILLKALEKLTCMDFVLESFKDDPSLVVEFIISFLNEYSKSLTEQKTFKNEECIVICLTLLSVLIMQGSKNMSMNRIERSLDVISEKSSHDGIKFLCNEINRLSSGNESSETSNKVSEFENAVNEICDPLLPVRAHGLMHLTKLIEGKDSETVSKKHYVQCIFEENLKSDDSYIYLSAINGLAAMANYSTDDVLEVLTREFSDTKKELNDENETAQIRMKIGEILVKVTKNLGEMAAAHKSLLLNTFLCGCKDHDPLIRASSLSNLAEVSRVLNYKLGPVLYEMLNCINSILETDKSQECRRACVLVVTSLLKGLGREALYFLREALLPMYRTLKKLYNNESEDQTVRLHAQIGLEELNNIVKGMIFSPIAMEKRIVIEKPM